MGKWVSVDWFSPFEKVEYSLGLVLQQPLLRVPTSGVRPFLRPPTAHP